MCDQLSCRLFKSIVALFRPKMAPWVPALFARFNIGWKRVLVFHYLPPLQRVSWPARTLTFFADKNQPRTMFTFINLHPHHCLRRGGAGGVAISLSPRLPCESGSYSLSSGFSKSAELLIRCVGLAVAHSQITFLKKCSVDSQQQQQATYSSSCTDTLHKKTWSGLLHSLLTADYKLLAFPCVLSDKNVIRQSDYIQRQQQIFGWEQTTLFSASRSCSAEEVGSFKMRSGTSPTEENCAVKISRIWPGNRSNITTRPEWRIQAG